MSHTAGQRSLIANKAIFCYAVCMGEMPHLYQISREQPAEHPDLIDKGYGDSDVFVVEASVEGNKESFIRKAYNTERIYAGLQKNLQPEIIGRLPGYRLLKTHLPVLRSVERADLGGPIIEVVLERYIYDTRVVSSYVSGNREKFTYEFDSIPGLETVNFEVVPQGDRLYRLRHEDQNSPLILDGQKVIPGRNLEQIVKGPELQRSTISSPPGSQDNIPPVFLQESFINTTLVRFQTDLLRNMDKVILANKAEPPELMENLSYYPPIYNGFHYANIIPERQGDDKWVFKITDLSTSIALDYGLLLAAMASGSK